MGTALQEVLLTALGTVLTGLIGYGFMLLRSYTNSKIKNEELKTVVNIATTVVQTAVLDVSENFVKKLKAKGSFSKEDAEEALRLTKEKAVKQITAEGKVLIEKHFGDFDVWLEQQIEAFVAHK